MYYSVKIHQSKHPILHNVLQNVRFGKMYLVNVKMHLWKSFISDISKKEGVGK